MKKDSVWNDTSLSLEFPTLHDAVAVDVLIVGGGITGLTTAYLLKQAGRRVAVVDQQDIGGGETSHTTAHLTHVTDARLHELAGKLGNDAARAFWESGRAAIEQIGSLAEELDVDCEFRKVPGYLFAAEEKDAEAESKTLKEDARLAADFGFDATWIGSDPMFHRPAVRFANQAKFHPLRYLASLAKAIPGDGSHVFSKTSGSGINEAKHELRTGHGTIRYKTLVAATHVPIQGETGTLAAALFQTKLAAYSSYAIGAKVPATPAALFWDTLDPYHYWRFDDEEDGSFVILGGEDHKTGQEEDTESRYENLEKLLREKFLKAKLTHRWSGQVIETPDGMPFIGEVSERQYLATGFSGNGMTLGTFSAMLLRDLITDRKNPWTDLFDPHRKRLAGAWDYLRENKDFPVYFVKDRLAATEDLADIKRTTGGIVKINGKKCAVYCDEHGKRTVRSAICPHMGCLVAWNPAEKTWDCPCHGSRFTATGDLIAGPAEAGLEPVAKDSE
ncbi:MAG: FAD-dependent oxidoreductase [Chthoniobacterales bacterium]